jgi:hypothetical protein
MGTARVRMMSVEQVHAWGRGIAGLPRGDADAFAGQCFLEDIDGAALLAQTRESLCEELGVAAQHVDVVEAAIKSLQRNGVDFRTSVASATPRSIGESFHDLLVAEGLPPTSPAAAARISARRTPASTPDLALQVERRLSALQDRHGGVVEQEKRLSQEAFAAAEHERVASVAAAEAVRLDLQAHSEVSQAIEQRAAAAEREAREVRQESEALMATAESRHTAREAELVAQIDELMARVATETEARVAAERDRDEMENELALAQAMGEAAEEQLAIELGRAREERAATKIQMIWRVHRVTQVALSGPLNHRALLLEVESARVAAAVTDAQSKVRGYALHKSLACFASPACSTVCGLTLYRPWIQAHELQQRLALQEKQLASEARMREAMQQYAKQRMAMKSQPLSRLPSHVATVDQEQALLDLVSTGKPGPAVAAAKRTPTNSPTAAVGLVASSPVTPVTDYEPARQMHSKERLDMRVQEARQQAQQVQPRGQSVVALDEV